MAYSTTNQQENSGERDFFTYKRYRVDLPRPEDLEDPESPYRIKDYYEKNGSWFLTNHLDQEYSRYDCYPPAWYFRTGEMHYFVLDKRTNGILENVYGRYVGIPCDEDSVKSRKEQNLSYKTAQVKNRHMVSGNANDEFQKLSSSQPIKGSNFNPNLVSVCSEQPGLHQSMHRNNFDNQQNDLPQTQFKDNKKSLLSETPSLSGALVEAHRKISDTHEYQNSQENEKNRGNSLQSKRSSTSNPWLRLRARNMIRNAIRNKRENQSAQEGNYEPPDDLTHNLAISQNQAKQYQASSNELISGDVNLSSLSLSSGSSQAINKPLITVKPSKARLKQALEAKEKPMVENPANPASILETLRNEVNSQTPSLTNRAFQRERLAHISETDDTTRRLRSSSESAGTKPPILLRSSSVTTETQPRSLLYSPDPLDPNSAKCFSAANNAYIGSDRDRMLFESETKDSSSLVKNIKPSDVKIKENSVPCCNRSDYESLGKRSRQLPQKTTSDSNGHNLENKNFNNNRNLRHTKPEQTSESSAGMTCTASANLSKPLENNVQLCFNTHSKATYSADSERNKHTVVNECISDENFSSDVNNQFSSFPLIGNDSAVKTRRGYIGSLKDIREKSAVSLGIPEVTGNEDCHVIRNYSSLKQTKHTVLTCPSVSNVASATTSSKSEPTTIFDSSKKHEENIGTLRDDHEGAKLCLSNSTPLNSSIFQNEFTVEGDIAQHNDGSLIPLEKTSAQKCLNETIKPATSSPETSCSSGPLSAGKHISTNIFSNQAEQEQHCDGSGIGMTEATTAATSITDVQTFSDVSFLPLCPGDCSEAKCPRINDILLDSPSAGKEKHVEDENESGSIRTYADVMKNDVAITSSSGTSPNERNSQSDTQQYSSKLDRIRKENMKKQRKTVWENIVGKFKTRCKCEGDFLKEVPLDFEPEKTSVEKIFNLNTVTLDAQKQKIKPSYGFRLRQTDNTNLILVRGPTCFGKTTFLSLLAYQWASNTLFSTCALSKFNLCVYLHLRTIGLENINLSEAIRKHLNQRTDACLLQEVLTDHADEIVFLFDGYDELSKCERKVVKSFLNTPDLFEKSKIIVSVRPEASEEIGYLFHRVIDIKSISIQQENKILKKLKPKNRTFSKICNASLKDSLAFLSELPPYFIYFINEIIDSPLVTDTFADLYSLFDSSLQFLIRFQGFSHQYIKPSAQRSYRYENVFNRLGKLMFSALLQGRRVFQESLLRSQFVSSDFNHLQIWNILYPANESESWTTTCKFLMVFFATKYLKYEWENQTTNARRKEFLTKVFCGNACSGDYVLSKGEQPCLFFVGLIPEIVLKLYCGSLEKATFEMYYDVQGVEFSNAFDTVNLLVRVNERYLPRFAFKTRDIDDPQLNSDFENVLCNLTINNCYVDHCFYENVFEKTTFLEAVAQDSDDGNIVLHTVFRNNANGVTNSVLIDFTLSRRNDIWDFTFAMLSHHLQGFALKEPSTSSDVDFLLQLVLAVLQSQLKQKIVVSCVDSFAEGTLQYQNNMKFVIFYNPQTKQMSVKYSVPKYISGSFVYDAEVKAKDSFLTSIQRTKKNISNSLFYMKNPKVTVQILRSRD